ncbi:MAG: ATP-grasp domain-containing protein [Chitinophagaceae bacterium]|nr:MAG: ATP-grasp domain-containing protein [Chitinophagaceae bacterium]
MRFLITAIGSMSADAVICSLRENFPGCEITGTNLYPAEWLYEAGIVDATYKVPMATEVNYVESIADIIRARNIDMVIPLTDPEVDVLSENRETLEAFSAVLALCKNEVISVCRDKELLYNRFTRHPGVQTIRSYSVSEVIEKDLNFPMVAKPKKGRSSEGLKYIASRKELFLLDEKYMVQEFIRGTIITVDFVRDPWNNTVCIPRKELIRSSNGAGLSVEIFRDKAIGELINEIAEDLGITGCMNIEFIHSGDSYYLMDINPRFSAGIGFSKLAGYDFVKNHVNVFRKNKIEPVTEILTGIAAKHCKEYMLGH